MAVAAAATPEPGPADLLADWRGYAEPEAATWPTEPLADERWAQVTAELGCVGRAHHGNPGAHRAAMNKVLAHGRTTADAVMEYGIGVNADPTRAHALGGRVAEAVQRCR